MGSKQEENRTVREKSTSCASRSCDRAPSSPRREPALLPIRKPPPISAMISVSRSSPSHHHSFLHVLKVRIAILELSNVIPPVFIKLRTWAQSSTSLCKISLFCLSRNVIPFKVPTLTRHSKWDFSLSIPQSMPVKND